MDFLNHFLIKKFYCYSITVVCIFYPSLHPKPANPTSLSGLTLPLDFVHVSFIVAPVNLSPHYPLPMSSHKITKNDRETKMNSLQTISTWKRK